MQYRAKKTHYFHRLYDGIGVRDRHKRPCVRRFGKSVREAGRCLDHTEHLNEWMLWGRPLRWLRRHFPPTPDIRTWPARFPVFALDQFLVRPRIALKSLRSHRSDMARIASDHLPIVADLAP